MTFELFIALRYLLARRRQAFISVISLISAIGVAVGVMALVVALALMTGLQGELRDRILGSTAHVYVWRTGGIEDYRAEVEKLRALEGVAGAGPAILGKALISTDRADAFTYKHAGWLAGLPARTAATLKELAAQFARAGTESLESPQVFQMPEVVRAGGLPALRSLGEPAQILQETKGRLFAA